MKWNILVSGGTLTPVRFSVFLSGLTLAVCLAAAVPPARAQDPPPGVPLPTGKDRWELIFNDEFEGTAYDTDNWNPYADWGGTNSFNNGLEVYYPEQVRVSNGICNLVAEPHPTITSGAGSYKSGEIISARANTSPATPYKVSFLYGYVEARIKIVNVSGFFGAFWMIPSKTNYVYEWEIDILEVLGHDPNNMFQTYHYREGLPYNLARNDSWSASRRNTNNVDYSTDYHTYGVDWQPDRLAFYIDGVNVGTFPDPGTSNGNIPRTEGYILIQQMVENDWVRATGQLVPDRRSSVDTFHVDYVRVWQGREGSAVHYREGTPEPPVMTVTPNPMRDRVTFLVREAGSVDLPAAVAIYNAGGSMVRRITGTELAWDGHNGQGQPARPGLYFYTLRQGRNAYTGSIMRVQ